MLICSNLIKNTKHVKLFSKYLLVLFLRIVLYTFIFEVVSLVSTEPEESKYFYRNFSRTFFNLFWKTVLHDFIAASKIWKKLMILGMEIFQRAPYQLLWYGAQTWNGHKISLIELINQWHSCSSCDDLHTFQISKYFAEH